MYTVRQHPFLSGLFVVVGSAALLAATAAADLTSDTPAGLLVFPKLVANQNATQDTIIQMTNTSDDMVRVRCYLVNANSHCSNSPTTVCTSNSECRGGICLPGWQETDFRFTLTRRQPIYWRLSEGKSQLDFPLDGIDNITQDGQFNEFSNIPPAPELPFVGELKCFQVDENENPVARNDLKGEATIVDAAAQQIDAEKYNALGLPSTGRNDGDDTLCLGGAPTPECPEAEYNGCPGVVIVDHFFDDAPEPVNGDSVRTRLTIVPCSEDFLTQTTFKTTIQFLVFNEFEQRLSTSRRMQCFEDIGLSDIDTRPGDSDDFASIFNFAVQGTLTGQSRLRAVQTGETNLGHGIVVVASERHEAAGDSVERTAAFNTHYDGLRSQAVIIRAPRQ